MAKRFLLVVAALVVMGVGPRAAVAVTLEEEISLGKKIDTQIMKDNKLYSDDAAERDAGLRPEALEVREPASDNVPLQDPKDDQFNAFSVPGGYVYFTDKLWRVLGRSSG